MNRHFMKENIQTGNENMLSCLTSSTIREMSIKTIIRYYYTSMRIAKIKNIVTAPNGGGMWII